MKMFKRTLTMLLALCMLLSLVPMTAFATETDNTESVAAETEAVSEETAEVLAQLEEGVVSSEALTLSAVDPEDFIRAFALDCGRLYFSVESIKEIIDVMAANDYTHLTLAFGNSGFRFLLDDMTIGSYSSDAVKNAIMAGNDSYVANDGHNGSTARNTCLTQADMDAIITYANGKGIEIIPALNSPGHMNTIVYAMGQLGIQNAGYPVNSSYHSESTLNINDDAVMAFSDALIRKYITYFDGKGCKYFNLGADEFANDPTDDVKLGFNNSMKAGFINYVNRVASMITDAGMTPMMFNDGYAWLDADFNDDIVVCYWTGGAVSSATIANAGHKVINNSQRYYYVLGEPFGSEASSWCSYASATNGVNNVPVTRMVDGGNPDDKLIGSQMWLWCDYTDEEYTAEEETRVKTLISTLAENNPDYFDIPEAPAEPETRSVTVGIDGTTDTIENKAYTEAQIADPTKVSVELTVTEESVSSTAATALEDGATYILRIAGSNLALSKNQSQTRYPDALALQNNNLAANPDHLWQLEASGSGYKLKCADGYLAISEAAATINSTGEVFTFTQNGSGWQIVDADNYAFNNLGGEGALGGWNAGQNPLTMELYAATPASTEVKFTGKASGNTTVTVGHVTYDVSVEVAAFDGETVDVNILVGETYTCTDTTGRYADTYSPDGLNTNVATVDVKNVNAGVTTVLEPMKTIAYGKENLFYIQDSNGKYLTSALGTTNNSADAARWYAEATDDEYEFFVRLMDNDGDDSNDKILTFRFNVGQTPFVTLTFTTSATDTHLTIMHGNELAPLKYCDDLHYGTPVAVREIETVDSTTVTVKGVSKGSTSVLVGGTLYNIHVRLDNKEVELKKGQTVTYVDESGNYKASYTGAGLDTSIATVDVEGTTGDGSLVLTPLTEYNGGKDKPFYIQTDDGQFITYNGGLTTDLSKAELWYMELRPETTNEYHVRSTISGLCVKMRTTGEIVVDSGLGIAKIEDGKLVYNSSIAPQVLGTPVTASVSTSTTTVTITGASRGETSVAVGNTRYNITVTEDREISVYAGLTVTDTIQNATVGGDFATENPSVATATAASDGANTIVTFTGKTAGTTNVLIGNVYYTIRVIEPEHTVEVALRVGETFTYTDESGNYENEIHNWPDAEIATMEVTGTAKDPNANENGVALNAATSLSAGTYVIVNSRAGKLVNNGSNSQSAGAGNMSGLKLEGGKDSAIADSAIWTITPVAGGYTVQDSNGKYMTIASNSAAVVSTESVLTLNYNNGKWTLSQNGAYLNDAGGYGTTASGWQNNSAAGDVGSQFDIYAYNDPQVDTTKITFEGVKRGTTTAVVGHTAYNITVSEPENRDITIGVNQTVSDTIENFVYTQAEIADSSKVSAELAASGSNQDTLVTFTGREACTTTVTVGHIIYNITVIPDDQVTEPRNIELQVGQVLTDTIEVLNTTATYTPENPAIASVVAEGGQVSVSEELVEVTSLDQIIPGEQYLIVTSVSNKTLTGTVEPHPDRGGETVLNIDGTVNIENPNLWTINKEGNTYYFSSDANGQYLTFADYNAGLTTELSLAKIELDRRNNYWLIKDQETGSYLTDNGNRGDRANGWSDRNDATNMWRIYRLVKESDTGTNVTFTGLEAGATTVTVGHVRYNITVVDFDVTETRNIFVQVGHSVTDTILNHAYYGAVVDDNTIASVDVNAESGSATMVSTSPATQLEDGATYILRIENTELALSKNQSTGNFSNGRALETNNLTVNQDHLWTLEASGSGYKLKNAEGNYLSIGYQSASVGSTGEVFTFTASGNGWVISDNENYAFNALGGISYRSLGGWNKNENPLTMQLYKVTTASEGATEVTFNGLKVGTTTATVGHVLYNITVTAGETALTYHPWISTYAIYPEGTGAANCTNGQGVPRDVSIPVTTEGVYSEQGVEIASLVDPTGDWRWEGDAQTVYWKATVLPEGRHQTGVVDTDYAMKGSDFAYIRYWDGNWEYSADRVTWTAVKSTDEVCVYYLQETDVTQEIETFVKDWAFTPDNADDGQDRSYQKALSFAVVYPGGTMNPTEEDIYQQSTLIYYDNLANLGFIRFANNSTYEIEKITYTFGERVNPNVNGNYKWTPDDAINWEKKTIDDHTWFDETVCWDPSYGTEPVVNGEDLEDVIYCGNPGIQGAGSQPTTDYDGSWGRDDAILLLVYLKPIVTEDSLTVVYYDEKFGEVLHTYPINVDAGNNFNDHLGKVTIDSQGNVTLDTNQDAPAFTGNDKNRIDLTSGFGIENSDDVIQRFQTDLTKIPSIIGKYNSELYQYTGSEIKDDGKTLYLYYNFNEAALPVYVVDFGLPLSFNLNQITEKPVNAVSVVEQTKYGNLMCRTTKDTGAIFIYQPTSILQGADMLTINLTFTDGKSSTVNVRVIPATTVYYEEGFLFNENSTDWETTSNKGKYDQLAENLGHKVNNYGYDEVYADTAGASDETNATTSTIGAKTEFTFTGKGIQIFANATEQSGYVAVEVMNSSDEVVNMSLVDTAATNGGTGATTGQNTNLYGLPIVSLVDLQNMPHDTYTVTMTKIMDSETVYIDGVRIFNTLADSGVYAPDLEDNPEFYELRDYVLKAINITDKTSADYGTLAEMAGQVYGSISSDEERPVAVITENKGADDIYGEGATAQDLLDNGPKNELYLREGQTLTFKVTTGRFMQLGLKAPNGAASVQLLVDGEESEDVTNITSSVDMFYTLAEPGDSDEHTVSITNEVTDDGKDSILSVTLLKVCDDPSFAFAALTAEDVEDILVDVYGFEDDKDPVDPEDPVNPEEPVDPEDPVDPDEPVDPEDPVDPEKPENNKPGFHWPIFNWPGFNWPGFDWPGQDKPEDKPEVEPEIPSEPSQNQANAELKINLVDYTGKTVATAVLTENGTRGELCSFEAQQILDAAASKLPAKYQIVDDAAVANVEVTYGAVSEIVIQVGKVATLEVTYISIFGRKIGTATLTKVQTSGGRCVFTAKEIQQAAPKGHNAFFVMPATVSYGSNASVTVTVF